VINLSLFKIQLENSEFYKSKNARVQHYKSSEKAAAKIEKLGEIATGAIVVESKTRKLEKIATDTKIVRGKTKKAAAKAEKPASSKTKKKTKA
jgi:hypothetical protein